jgi:hypothetical protein
LGKGRAGHTRKVPEWWMDASCGEFAQGIPLSDVAVECLGRCSPNCKP